MKAFRSLIVFLPMIFLTMTSIQGQEQEIRSITPDYPFAARVYDSILAARLPLLQLPESCRGRLLPVMVDNSQNDYWPGIKDQYILYTCQQYSGVAYVYGYEINRLRNQPGWYWDNSYPAHYTWNFMNQGERYTGVNYLQSFEVIRQQGHMTSDDYGPDTATSFLGWISGYDKYYRGMFNHLKQVYAIKVNSADGINTLRNYLYDHLDGSSAGGIACFSTNSATLIYMPKLPGGTPEEGKNVITAWQTDPVHGMAVVGYNDSIRYDINKDGKYTNNIDINLDGIIDARDWEIGGFKLANSYGHWWSNDGFVYALYRTFAMNYIEGGVWNNRVYVVEADTAYEPRLTMKVKLNYDSRNKIRILAGVSSDTLQGMPDHEIDFPIFNFQGGAHSMQGADSLPDSDTIEFGLDVTPLLNFVSPVGPARYYLMVEERDPDHLGQGSILKASFINYVNGRVEFPVPEENVIIKDNDVTLVSVVGTMAKPVVLITTASLPPLVPAQPYQVQLEATGGKPPYSWSLQEKFTREPSVGVMPMITGTSIQSYKEFTSYTAVALPFSFPFYGKKYDTIYVNNYGFITFDSQYLPEPYVTDEMNMLEMFPTITPAFSQEYTYQANKNDGIWFQADASHAVIRWKVSVLKHLSASVNDFALILYPDGQFEFRYGTMNNQGFRQIFYSGISKGDEQNFMLERQWNADDVAGKSFKFKPPLMPAGLALEMGGLLTVVQADSTQIYDLPVQVADAGKITDSKVLTLCSGLELVHQLMCGTGDRLEFGQQACLKLVLTNTGNLPMQPLTIKIRSTDSLLQITDSVVSLPNLQPGVPVILPSAFSFGLKQATPNNFPVEMTIMVQSGRQSWNKEVQFLVGAPDLVIEPPRIWDGDNNILDPGEVADLVVSFKNRSEQMAQHLQLKLLSQESLITILSAPQIEIDRFEGFSSKEFRFQIKASRDALPGSMVAMKILLNDSLGVSQILDFSLQVGTKPIAIVSLSSMQSSAMAMMHVLDSLHVGYDTLRSMQFDCSRYASIFLILGTAVSGTYVLNESEGALLADYLRLGGNLYMEGYYTWYYAPTTTLHPMLKYTSKRIPAYYYQHVTGVPGTFTDAMNYNYTAALYYAIFNLEPVSPAYATLINADNSVKNLEIVYDGNDYKTIATMLDFSALTDGAPPSAKATLMQRYLEFFELNITGPYPLFHAARSTLCRNSNLVFNDDSYDHITSRYWEFEGGTPATSTEQDPVVVYAEPGIFDVKLTVSDGLHSKSVLKENYITVGHCSGLEEANAASLFRIFPNPSSDRVTIEFKQKIIGNCHVRMFDLAGCQVMEMQQLMPSNNRISMDVSGLTKGFYFLSVQAGELISVVKLIRN